MKVLLVCSSGGHFKGIEQLRPYWEQHERVWVTFKTATTQAALAQETVYWAFSPTNRNLPNLFKNLLLAFQVISQTQPDLIISTGAGVAVPFLILGKLFGSKTAFIESVTRIQTLSLSAKLVLPFLSVLYVQWPQLQARYPQAELIIPQESV
ncbi:UDP-N-acetylglucosamine--LPS N-acetylglucosamine transferase [Tolypothrix sp. FACHB-123]|uniref:PssD/Cps14F family polysaccharide biosynthesis glycosyltransferase n=1 Tax=Tolypothrix sp. FACHB-123 TaxID=2692868 RepID=UPI00168A34BC|nr:PssD/Cps14F family polysaccharide biosynthesis glycosyltransferase [Tolypothrix sp. FACHB-123]MBD2355789.1 UDP-N-acetylglucosamine--LPS N-acetylglucosamine transferase [Tolypothrix sp. FACHB-123]